MKNNEKLTMNEAWELANTAGWSRADPHKVVDGPQNRGPYNVIVARRESRVIRYREGYQWNGAYWTKPAGGPSDDIILAWKDPAYGIRQAVQ